MDTMATVSVLMSTYASERDAHLRSSLASLFEQTLLPDQIILVLDGPVPAAQEEVIAEFTKDTRVRDFTVLRLPKNVGLAAAMNAGLPCCVNEWTMRMDSDDVCLPDRLRLQLEYAVSHPEIDVVSSWSEEFSLDCISRTKVSPIRHEHIVAALRWRNVLIHPTILIRTSVLKAVGGYSASFRFLEDYDLFVRLALAGYRFHVVPKTLVRMRSSPEQYARRGGVRYLMNELAFRRQCLRLGFLRPHQFLVTASLYAVFRLVSGPLRRSLYALART